MEKIKLEEDIKVFCVTASSFPAGILAAHQKLHALLPTTEGRHFYGISYPEGPGAITYKAAVEESYPGEAEKLGCEVFIIRQGAYLSETLKDWRRNEAVVASTFQKMIADPRIDKNGYCLEIYINEKDMKCLIKLDPANA